MITALHDADDRDDLQAWVDEFEITHLVGGDYEDQIWDAYTEEFGRPQFAVIDRSFDLVYVGRDQELAHQTASEAL